MIKTRAQILAKGGRATPEETNDLRRISTELDRMGFASVFSDPIYSQFVAAMGRRPEFMKPVLTSEEMAEQEKFADEVLNEIMDRSEQ